MGVTAEDKHLLLGVSSHYAGEAFTGDLRAEMRQPLVIRDPPVVPARLTERRYVGEDDDLPVPFYRLLHTGAQPERGSIAEIVQTLVPRILVDIRQFFDVIVVIEHHVRTEEVAETTVCPQSITDERGFTGECEHFHPGQKL